MYFGPDHTIVIAEAGINHDGDFEKALRMIDVAVEAKADFVKFQTFKADVLVLPEAERSTYIVEGSHEGESFRDLLRRLEQSYDQQRQLKEICDEKGIKFLSTAFDHDSLDFLCDELKCEIIKIPSGDLTNLPFLRHAASKKLPIVLSTGMGDLDEIDEAMETLQSTGAEAICLLHCVSWYPCPMEIANLRAMLTLRDRYGTPVGYSDHTLGVALPPAAVALGARVIEKHYTLDPDDFGPDHKASLSPEELVTMVSLIRDVECGLGSGRKGADSIDDIELNQRRVHRRSIVTTKPVKSGEAFTRENLGLKRPGTGMPPREFEFLLGKTAARDIASDSLLSPADVAG
jgi:N,N'-diacetyllegionaminate synthase